MLGTKYEIANVLTNEAAEEIHDELGIAVVVTDGKNIQIDID